MKLECASTSCWETAGTGTLAKESRRLTTSKQPCLALLHHACIGVCIARWTSSTTQVAAQQQRHNHSAADDIKWVFLGPPGVGKGTYASRVANAQLRSVCHLLCSLIDCQDIAPCLPGISLTIAHYISRTLPAYLQSFPCQLLPAHAAACCVLITGW